MLPFTLHHYGYLTVNTDIWLKENELLFGKPFHVSDKTYIDSQKVNVTFVQQTESSILLELVEPDTDNNRLHSMITRGITIYHTAYTVPAEQFESTVKMMEQNGAHALPVFRSGALQNRRCIFLFTQHVGLIEIVEG